MQKDIGQYFYIALAYSLHITISTKNMKNNLLLLEHPKCIEG